MGNPMKMGIGQPPLGVSIPATMDGSDQPPERIGKSRGKQKAKSQTPPEQGGSQGSHGSQPSQPSSDSTTAGFNFDSKDSGYCAVRVKIFHPDYPDGDISRCTPAEIVDQNLRYPHPGRIFGSSKSDPSKVVFTPFSKNFAGNPGIIPVPAAKYFTGKKINEESKVHAGTLFETLKDNVKMWDKDQRDFQISKHSQYQFLRLARQNADTMAGSSPSGGSLEEHRGERPPSRRPTVPYSYGRDSVPQERTGFHPESTNQYPTERARYSGDDRRQRPTSSRHSGGRSSRRHDPCYSQYRGRPSTSSRHSGGGDWNRPRVVITIPTSPLNTMTSPLPPHDTVAVVIGTVPRVVITIPTSPLNTVTSPLPPHDTMTVVMGTVPCVVIAIPTTPPNTMTSPLPPHNTVAVVMEAVAVIRLPGVVIMSALPGDDINPMLVANVGKSRYMDVEL